MLRPKDMKLLPLLLAVGIATIVGCTKEPRGEIKSAAGGEAAPPAPDSTKTAAVTPVQDTGAMAGMDHSKMSMQTDTAGTSKAPSSSRSTPGPKGMADMPGMAGMPSMSGRTAVSAKASSQAPRQEMREMQGMAGMDHSRMSPRTSAMPSMPMERSPMPMPMQMPTATEAADMKLQQIAAILVQDSVVQRRIAADSALSSRWHNPVVRRLLLGHP